MDPWRILPPFEGEHLWMGINKLADTYLPQGVAPRFPHGWLKKFGSPGYPHYDKVDSTWQSALEMKC